MTVKELEPKRVFEIFDQITKVPRPSKKEEKIRQYLLDFAKSHNLEAKTDKVGNVVIKAPATPGHENAPTVILQGHMDLIEAPTIENDEIPALYRRAKVTLNDHWQDMLDYQFVNNRIFDALACGLPVISDGCEELREIFPEAVLYYSSREEFEQCLEKLEGDYESIKACVRSQWEMIHEKYSFQARARELVELAKKYREQEITPVPILPIH